MERVQPPGVGSEQLPSEQVPFSRDPARLPGLITEAQRAPASERPHLARNINALLVDMRAPGNEAAEAQAVLKALSLESLEGLVDPAGRSCRAEAVETLLACGFPHALQVTPEDLEHHSAEKTKGSKGPMTLVLASAVFAAVLISLSRAEGAIGDYVEPIFWGLVLIAGLAQQLFRWSTSHSDRPKP